MSETRPIRESESATSNPFGEILVGLALLVSACTSILLTRVPGGIALLWPGTAIAAALLIRLPRVRWSIAAASIAGALVLANVLVALGTLLSTSWILVANSWMQTPTGGAVSRHDRVRA